MIDHAGSHTMKFGGVAATASGTMLAAASDFWQGVSAAGIASGILVVGGAAVVLYDQLNKARIRAAEDSDKAKLRARKEWDDANKDSLTAQLDESGKNQEKMRATLHRIEATLSAREMEADELRKQLSKAISQLIDTQRQLHETDQELHDAKLQLTHTTAQMQTNADRMPGAVRSAVREGISEAAQSGTIAVRPEGPA